MIVMKMQLAAAIVVLAVELEDQMFSVHRELCLRARMKVKAPIQARPPDDIRRVRRADFEDLSVRIRRPRGAAAAIEQGHGVASRRPADIRPIRDARPSAPLVGGEHLDGAGTPGVLGSRQDGQSQKEECNAPHDPEPITVYRGGPLGRGGVPIGRPDQTFHTHDQCLPIPYPHRAKQTGHIGPELTHRRVL